MKFLTETAQSLREQTFRDFEWILVPNSGCREIPPEVTAGLPAMVGRYIGPARSIGNVKRVACEYARGDVIVELDHDDLLTPDALGKVAKAFEDPEALSVYSNCAEFWTESWKPRVFSEAFGWRYRDFEYRGHKLKETVAFPPNPQTLSSILFTPNHLRAWRTTTYQELGGHDVEMKVADDYDLMCRLFLAGKMVHIDECLYLYRLHDGNSCYQPDLNPEIQQATLRVRDKYLQSMVEVWALSNEFPMIDLCCGANAPEGYIGVDRTPSGQVVWDLDDAPWPFTDSSVGVVRAFDALEHLRDPVQTMTEIYRILRPGGWLLSLTPSTDGRGAFQDPTHCSFWNEHSFWYWTRKQQAAFIGHSARFQEIRCITFFPEEWHKEHNIPYVRADLVAIKGNYSGAGAVLI